MLFFEWYAVDSIGVSLGVLGFAIGLGVGLALTWLLRYRYDSRLKALLRKTQIDASSVLPYDSQLASAISVQQFQADELRQQIESFRQILQFAPVGYLQVNEENQLLWCNLQAQKIFDIKHSEREQPRLLLALVRSYELDQLIERTRQTQMMCQQAWTFHSISPDPYNVSERPAYPIQGRGIPLPMGQVGIFLESRRDEIAFAQQRDRWLSDVAHELKTPLTSIRLVGETLQDRVDVSLRHWVERLIKEVVRLGQLVDDVLNLSHLEQRSQPDEEATESDLVQLVHNACQSLEPLARLKHIEFDYTGPQQLVARANPGLMQRVYFNLLNNAVKYSPTHQPIQVRLTLDTVMHTAQPGQRDGAVKVVDRLMESDLAPSLPAILFEVIDHGCGFLERDLPHVFERFYRSDPARSRTDDVNPGIAKELKMLTSSGTGLGLAIVSRIVSAHQGWVQAQNHPETGGGWLKVWLPGERLKSIVPPLAD